MVHSWSKLKVVEEGPTSCSGVIPQVSTAISTIVRAVMVTWSSAPPPLQKIVSLVSPSESILKSPKDFWMGDLSNISAGKWIENGLHLNGENNLEQEGFATLLYSNPRCRSNSIDAVVDRHLARAH